MKLTRVCPKCGASDIVRIDGYTGPYGTGNNVMTGKTIFSGVNVNRYVCLRCGYSEEWISNYVYKIITLAKKEPRPNSDEVTK